MKPQADTLARALAAIDDAELRARKAAALLAAMPADFAARAIGAWVRGAAAKKAGFAAAAEAVQRALHDLLDDALRADLRAAAAEADEPEALALLSKRPPSRSFDSGEPGYVDREMQSRTLGHRRQLARGNNRDLLTRLAHDQDPLVLRHLLENPRVTEREALLAASKRPTHPAVLEEVFRSRRFSRNRRVRKALAMNPYSPPALAAAALSMLTRPELQEVLRDHGLTAEVREHASRLLSLRT